MPATVTTQEARHLLLHLAEGARFTSALTDVLRDEVVLAGWLRASGVLADVELRTIDARTGSASAARRLDGFVQLVSLEGAVGLTGDEPTFAARALLARETATGLETFAGEIVDARVVALEAHVIAFDRVGATRTPAASGLAFLGSLTTSAASPAPAAPAAAPLPAPSSPSSPATSATWADAARASETASRPAGPAPAPAPAPRAAPPATTPAFGAPAVIPPRPIRRAEEDDDQIYPDAGDTVEHFAFGRCEVLKSDGDRLHVRAKDGRIKEIALEVLKVTSLPSAEGQTSRNFRLDRKL